MDGDQLLTGIRRPIYHNLLDLLRLSNNKNCLFSIQYTSLRSFVLFRVKKAFVHAILKSDLLLFHSYLFVNRFHILNLI